RHFSSSARQTWWVFCICLVGGGLGAHVLLLESILKPANAMKRLFASPETSPTWVFYEQCRGAYLFQTLFDAHFVFIWFLALAAVVSFYFALRQPSAWRTALAALLFAAITLVHIHEAVLLTLIAASVLVLLWRKGLLTPGVLVSSFCCLVPAWAMLALLLHIYSSSGLPVPDYRMYNMAIAILFVAYPLGWVLLAWGLSRYWERAGFLECFLLGWLLACTGMTLSGPFYTFGDRGLMTLLVPLYLIAGSIYFSHFRTVTPLAAALAVFVLALTPLREVRVQWRQSGFDPSASYRFLSPDHQAILVTLRHAADAKDVLLAHEDELRWLAPEYPGKTYYAHFFMTVNYWQKRSNVDRFFSAGAAEQDAFLRKEGIRFVYVEPGRNSASLADVHNLVPLIRNSAGTLFQYTGGDRQPQANSSAVDARREPT
ncbi:MAG TPA: hypothetical protein VFA18_21105, partial [Gemmataceae bacterium]|nr:hypothetical protein [Gemmataceae bacterium]